MRLLALLALLAVNARIEKIGIEVEMNNVDLELYHSHEVVKAWYNQGAHGNTTLDDQGDFGPTEALLDAIRGNKLAVLDLERRNMADDQLAKVWEALRGNTSVTELRAKYNNLAASGAALAAVLEANLSLIHI